MDAKKGSKLANYLIIFLCDLKNCASCILPSEKLLVNSGIFQVCNHVENNTKLGSFG